MNATDTYFASMVQKGLMIGIRLGADAFEQGNVQFFKDMVDEYQRLCEAAIYNHTNRVTLEQWIAKADELSVNSAVCRYDTTGEVARMNKEMFDNYAEQYYTQYVLPLFDQPLETITGGFDMQIEAMRYLVTQMEDGVTDDDREFMRTTCANIGKDVEQASSEELLGVLKR